MRITLYVSTNEEIGILSAKEMAALEKLRGSLAAMDIDIGEAHLNTSVEGWHHCVTLGEREIRHLLKNSVLRDVEINMPRIAYVIVPWVPCGAFWPESVAGDYFHTSWKIIMRAMEPLDA